MNEWMDGWMDGWIHAVMIVATPQTLREHAATRPSRLRWAPGSDTYLRHASSRLASQKKAQDSAAKLISARTVRRLDLDLVPLGGLARAVANGCCGNEVDGPLLVALVVKVRQNSARQNETPSQPVFSNATVHRAGKGVRA